MTPLTFPIFSGTMQPGTRSLAAQSVPLGYTTLKLGIDRTQWLDPAIKADGQIDMSFDGGATWTNRWTGFTAEGGPLQSPSPLPGASDPNVSTVQTDLGDPTNANRKIRASITVTGGPLTTTATLTIS